jgi:Holliday junction resolvase RusA-like endonuclease
VNISLTVLEEPVAKPRPRARNFGGRISVYTPTAAKEAEHRIRQQWRAEGFNETLYGPLRVILTAFVSRPQYHYRSGRNGALLRPFAPAWPAVKPDLDNYIKTVLDALNGVAWKDDAQVIDISASKRYASAGPARWEILVEEVER